MVSVRSRLPVILSFILFLVSVSFFLPFTSAEDLLPTECFVAGTQILMADGSLKPIESIVVGDKVLGQNSINTVTSLYHYQLGDQPLYSINDDYAFATKPHPFMTRDGWKAIDVVAAKYWNPHLDVGQLAIGDVLILLDGEVVVTSITPHRYPSSTPIYNFETDGDQSYFADGYLVHNKGTCSGGWDDGMLCEQNSDCSTYFCDEMVTCYNCNCGVLETAQYESCPSGWSSVNPGSCSAFPCMWFNLCVANGGIWCGTTSSGHCQATYTSPRSCSIQYNQVIYVNNEDPDFVFEYKFTDFTLNDLRHLEFRNYNSPIGQSFNNDGALSNPPLIRFLCHSDYYDSRKTSTPSNIYYLGGTSGGCDGVGRYGKPCLVCGYVWGGGGGSGAPGANQFFRGGDGSFGGCGYDNSPLGKLPGCSTCDFNGGDCDCKISATAPIDQSIDEVGLGGSGGNYAGGNVFFNVSGSFGMLGTSYILLNGADGTSGTSGKEYSNTRPPSGGGGGGAGSGGGSIRVEAATVAISPLSFIQARGGAGGDAGAGVKDDSAADLTSNSCAGGAGGGGAGGDIMIRYSELLGTITCTALSVPGGPGGTKKTDEAGCSSSSGNSGSSGKFLAGTDYCGNGVCGTGYNCDRGGRLPYCSMSGYDYFHGTNTCNSIISYSYCSGRTTANCGSTTGCDWYPYAACVPWDYVYNYNLDYYYDGGQEEYESRGGTNSYCFGLETQAECNFEGPDCTWHDFGWCSVDYTYCPSLNQASCEASSTLCVWGEQYDPANNACCGDDGASDVGIEKGTKMCTQCSASATDESGRSLIAGKYYWVHTETEDFACDGFDNDCDGLVDYLDTDNDLNCCDDAHCTAFGNGVCTSGVCSYPCQRGTDCGAPHNLCVDGICESSCLPNAERLCSSTNALYTNYGICTTDGCDTSVAAFYGSPQTYRGSCATLPNGVACDPDSLAGGYAATSTCIANVCCVSSPETCDSLDNNCDGIIDNEGATGCTNYYFDNDGDTYYATGAASKCLCAPDVANKFTGTSSGDCNDNDAGVWRTLNGYRDADGDSYTLGVATPLCVGAALPSGWLSSASSPLDCDDTVASCTTDCSTLAYRDADTDGYGTGTLSIRACDAGAGYVLLSGDCNDANNQIYPGASEASLNVFTASAQARCDGIDYNCDGSSGHLVECYPDADGDGIGAATGRQWLCSPNPSYTGNDVAIHNPVCKAVDTGYVSNYTFYTLDNSLLDPHGDYWDDAPFDCDDTDASAYWKCCLTAGEPHMLYRKTGVTRSVAQTDNIDWPWNVGHATNAVISYEPYEVSCCASATQCVYNHSTLGLICEAQGNYLNIGGNNPSSASIMCGAGNTWFDCDDAQSTCESSCGLTWAMPDASVIPFGGFTTDGALSQANRAECCGDDANEYLSVGACLASTNQNTICCNAPDLFNLDGVCVPESSCPDVMRTAPVWVEFIGASQAELDLVASTITNGGYCCNGVSDDPVTKPLCVPGDVTGCYVSLGAVRLNTPLGRTTCASADACVLEQTVPVDSPFSLCETSTTCSQVSSRLKYEHLTDSVLCTGSYTATDDVLSCYPKYDGVSDVSTCEPVVMTTCEGSDCKLLCSLVDGVRTSCSEVCESVTCSSFTTFRGPDSCGASGEQVCVRRNSLSADTIETASACSPASYCNEFGCWAAGCSACTSAGCPTCDMPSLYMITTSCEDVESCTAVGSSIACYDATTPQGFDFVVNKSSGGFLQCKPDTEGHDPLSAQGNVWCPPDTEFNVESDVVRCEKETDVCDSGLAGSLVVGCDNFLTPESDFWSRYNAGCVAGDSAQASALQTYDGACCLTSVLNDYQLYTISDKEDYVKVY